MKILLVDDDRDIADLVSAHLSLAAQHDVQSALSARRALQLIEAAGDPYDCFLVDIQMPAVDGIALVQLIREVPHYRTTPIVMLTAMTDKTHLDRAFSAGATDYITKPIDFLDLHARLDAARNRAVPEARRHAGTIAHEEEGCLGNEARQTAPGPQGPLHGIGSAIDFAEFTNYLRQLQSQRQFKVPTLAVKIHDVAAIEATSTPEGFDELVRNVAIAVEDTFMAQGGIMTYRGAGEFFCVPKTRLKGHRKALQRALNTKYLSSHPSDSRKIRLLVGDQVRLRARSEASVAETLEHALETVDRPDVAVHDTYRVRDTFVKRQRILLGEQ